MSLPGDFNAHTVQKSRKQRVCYVTGKIINIGDTYIRASGKYEGAMYNVAFHKDHETLLDAIDQKPELINAWKDDR